MPNDSAIEEYQFGKITVAGQRYTSDLIILPDRDATIQAYEAEAGKARLALALHLTC